MTDNKPLLFELGTEELPPKTLLTLSNALLSNITQALTDAELTFGQTSSFATPRRLAILIEDIIIQQPADRQLRLLSILRVTQAVLL